MIYSIIISVIIYISIIIFLSLTIDNYGYYNQNRFFIKNFIPYSNGLDYNHRLNFYTRHIKKVECDLRMNNIKTYNGTSHKISYVNDKTINTKKYKQGHRYMQNLYFLNSINNLNCLVVTGDIKSIDNNYPVITKTCLINKSDNSVLLPLAIKRHWLPILNVHKYDIPFDKKMNKVIWRGKTTGPSKSTDEKASRFDLVKKYLNKNSDINVGFSSKSPKDKVDKSYIKYPISMEKQLKYKYIIVVEGNDKASCLQWCLFSNSLVLMPKPAIVSWFMETDLKEYVHYVPLKNDFSDLEEKFEWCKNNQRECKKIINNSTNYVKCFCDPKREQKLIYDVIQKYKDNVTFV